MSGGRKTTPPVTSRCTPHRQPSTCSPNFSSTVTVHSRKNRTPAHCRTPRIAAGAVADIFDVLIATLGETRSNPTSTSCCGRPSISSIARPTGSPVISTTTSRGSDAASANRTGSEVRSVELERLIAEGLTLSERRDAMEFFRDHAADLFKRHTHTAWRPRTGSMVNPRALTAALINSREYLAAKRWAETEVMLPPGPKVAFTGGVDCNDHRLIWDVLDKTRAKHPDMVLLHGGSPKGAELIATKWADHRKVPQIAFKPDWTRHGKKAAPFSSATTRCLRCCRSASSCSPVPASRAISRTRRRSSASGLEIRQRWRVSAIAFHRSHTTRRDAPRIFRCHGGATLLYSTCAVVVEGVPLALL